MLFLLNVTIHLKMLVDIDNVACIVTLRKLVHSAYALRQFSVTFSETFIGCSDGDVNWNIKQGRTSRQGMTEHHRQKEKQKNESIVGHTGSVVCSVTLLSFFVSPLSAPTL